MKPTTEELMLQIISIAVMISLRGKWHANIYLHGKCGALDVSVTCAETGAQDRYTMAWFAHPDGWGGFTAEESAQHCLQSLTDQLQWIQGYLEVPAAPAQEAAA